MLKKSKPLLRSIILCLIVGIVHLSGFARNPLSCTTTCIKTEGTVVTRKGCKGRAQSKAVEADGPGGKCEGLTLFIKI